MRYRMTPEHLWNERVISENWIKIGGLSFYYATKMGNTLSLKVPVYSIHIWSYMFEWENK